MYWIAQQVITFKDIICNGPMHDGKGRLLFLSMIMAVTTLLIIMMMMVDFPLPCILCIYGDFNVATHTVIIIRDSESKYKSK